MIRAFVDSAKMLLRKPQLLIPTAVLALVNVILLYFTIEAIMEMLYSSLVLEEVPEATLLQMPYFLFSMYSIPLIIVALLVFFAFAVQAWLIYVYSKFVKDGEKANIVGAVSAGFANILNAMIISIFFMLAGFVYVVATFIVLLILLSVEILGIISLLLLLAWFLFGIYLFIKLYFLPVVMAIEGKGLKAALPIVWKWSQKRMIRVIVIIVAIFIIYNIINTAGLVVSDILPPGLLSTLLYYIFALIGLSYGSLVLVNYYNLNRA